MTVSLDLLPEDERLNFLPNPVPATLLARLAVHEELQGQGLGQLLMVDAFVRTLKGAEYTGSHVLVLDATGDRAKQFYQRFHFRELLDDPLHLYLPLENLKQLISAGEAEGRG